MTINMLFSFLAISGGNWNNGANAGVFALNLNNARSNRNTNIGARPTSDPPHSQMRKRGAKGVVNPARRQNQQRAGFQ